MSVDDAVEWKGETMAQGLSGSHVNSLRVLWEFGTLSGLDDGALLATFVDGRDASAELAFEVLVRRHGSMVLGVSRSILGDRQAAEDAFQAVFLVLARKARSIQKPDQLAPWLYGVALRTASESRKRENRRQKVEATIPETRPSLSPDHALIQREEAEALHGEIARLPEHYRAAVVLCDLEGLTQQEAASRLRCPTGTVAIRLKRAKERLRDRLTRRGIAPSGVLLTMARPAVTPHLIASTVQGAGATGLASASVVSLAEGVRWTMMLSKAKSIAVGALVMLGLATAWASAGGFSGTPLKVDDPPRALPQKADAPADSPRLREIRSKVNGYLIKTTSRVGERVNANDPLFVIDPKPFETAVEQALEQVNRLRAQKKLALSVVARNARLVIRDPNLVSREEREKAEAELVLSDNALTLAIQHFDQTQRDRDETRIKAPASGVLIQQNVKIGELIKADETVLGTLLIDEANAPAAVAEEKAVASPAKPEDADLAEFIGRTEVAGPEEILSRAWGQLEEIRFTEGQKVKAGEVLFVVDPTQYLNEYVGNEAKRRDAASERDAAKLALEKLEQVPGKDPDAFLKEKIAAQEKLARAERVVAVYQRFADEASRKYDLCSIKAPFDGVMSRPLAKVRDVIEPGKRVLATIVSEDRAAVRFEIDEKTFLRLRFTMREELAAGKIQVPVRVGLVDEEGFPREGSFSFAAEGVDPQTGTATLRAFVANADHRIVPGLFARVRMTLEKPAQAAQPVPEKAVARVLTREVRDYQDFPGQVEDSRETIVSEIDGPIDQVAFPEGGEVKEGTLLFEINAKKMNEQIAEATKNARINEEKAKARFDAANAAMETIEKDRRAGTLKLTIEEFEKAREEQRLAGRDLNMARQTYIAELAKLRKDLPRLTQIRARFDGKLARPMVKVGDMVEARKTVLAYFEATDWRTIKIDVPPATIDKLNGFSWQKGHLSFLDPNVSVTLAGENSFPLRGTIKSGEQEIEPATGVYRLKVSIRDRDKSILPGTAASVRLNLGTLHEVLLISKAAVLDQKVVYVLNEKDIIEARPVQLGLAHDGFWEVREGLKTGERVVIDDLKDLKPGMTIKPGSAAKIDR